jgi:hypothetical protein
VCAGYHKERVFILGLGTAYQAPKGPKTNSHFEVGKELSIRKKTNGPLKREIGCDGWDGPLAPTRFSQKAAYRQQILAEFVACSLPATYGGPVREDGKRSWLKTLPMLPDYTKALEASILAIATAKLGRVNENEVLLRESLKFYVTGLWELQKALWDPKSTRTTLWQPAWR